jgi:uncharacterized paraquat-inducible protein A
MPYLRCPNCGLLAHVITTAHAGALGCPRCRSHDREIRLTPLEESLRSLSPRPAERRPNPTR